MKLPPMVKAEGLVDLSRKKWWSPGYCGICGHRGESLMPRLCRYWDADDGWRTGILCFGCRADAAERGPRPDDYAVVTAKDPDRAAKVDLLATLGDDDACHTGAEDDL